jgi:hypothetical protein
MIQLWYRRRERATEVMERSGSWRRSIRNVAFRLSSSRRVAVIWARKWLRVPNADDKTFSLTSGCFEWRQFALCFACCLRRERESEWVKSLQKREGEREVVVLVKAKGRTTWTIKKGQLSASVGPVASLGNSKVTPIQLDDKAFELNDRSSSRVNAVIQVSLRLPSRSDNR